MIVGYHIPGSTIYHVDRRCVVLVKGRGGKHMVFRRAEEVSSGMVERANLIKCRRCGVNARNV